MNREARRFRHEAGRHIGDRTGIAIRYTPSWVGAVGIARRRRRTGDAVAAIARDLGLRPDAERR